MPPPGTICLSRIVDLLLLALPRAGLCRRFLGKRPGHPVPMVASSGGGRGRGGGR